VRRGALRCALIVAAAPWLLVPIDLISSDDRLRIAAAVAAFVVTVVGIVAAARLDRALASAGRTGAALVKRLPGGEELPEGCGDVIVATEQLDRQIAALGHRLSHRHQLTGLPTREPLLVTIRRDAEAASGGALLGLVEFVDIDRMSAFDATLSERALVALAERITRMVGGARMVAHVDRARFAVWFGSATPPIAARAELEAIGYALSDSLSIDGRELVPEVRIGAAAFPADAADAPALLARAIAALTLGPASSTDAVQDPSVAARETFALEQDLRHVVSRDQLELRFQPLIDGPQGRVCGAEALLRWHHPERGMISPAHFVPLVEAAGLADEVGLWTLNAACRAARGWQRNGLGGLIVAVNLSAHQLDREDLATLIERTLARHGLPASHLELELTESVAAADTARSAMLFRNLRSLGLTIAIDDFGTGYSSLSSLKKLSFDKLKIDREFVTDVDSRPDSQAICQSLIALGRGLGIRVLAEGVERREEYEWLSRHGCNLFQGFYFAPPLEAAQFIDFARDRQRVTKLAAFSPAALQAQIDERLAG
jgi:EAL domain-containing protein (putative c-di-GMP-specific phosphodiesterase class I)/GGDEF domain-containing protein